jgi:hypothetical protein
MAAGRGWAEAALAEAAALVAEVGLAAEVEEAVAVALLASVDARLFTG